MCLPVYMCVRVCVRIRFFFFFYRQKEWKLWKVIMFCSNISLWQHNTSGNTAAEITDLQGKSNMFFLKSSWIKMLQLFKKKHCIFLPFHPVLSKSTYFSLWITILNSISLEYIVHITTSHIELVSNAFDFFYQYALRQANWRVKDMCDFSKCRMPKAIKLPSISRVWT